MKKVLLAGVAAVSLVASGAAIAADLPSRQIEPIAPVVAPIFSWTGFYVGVNAGYAWNSNDDTTVWGNGVSYHSGNNDDGGFTGGGQIGYNYQFGQFVAGIEADINYADLKGKSISYTVPVGYFNGVNALGGSHSGIEWFGTVRARLGFAIDRALIYATGGFAYGGGGNSGTFSVASGNNSYLFQADDKTLGGWVLGGGLEYAFTNNITARVEGLYVNLGKSGNITPVGHNNWVNWNRKDNEFGVVRAGLNYKFDSF